MGSLVVPISILNDGALVPNYAYPGDAGVDLQAIEEVTLEPFERCLISTGLSIEIPQGYGGFVLPRSGLSSKHGISIINSPGLIDSNYRGEIKIALVNLDAHTSFTIHVGDRVAQLVIMAIPEVSFLQQSSLNDSQRGSRGFGSSGA